MGQQLSDIRTDAFDVFGYSSDDPMLDPTTVVNRLVNQAVDQFSKEFDWPWLYSEGTLVTASGTSDYAVPTRWHKTDWLAYEDHALQLISVKDMRSWVGDPDAKGPPAYWHTVGSTEIRLGPTPDGVYTIDHGYYVYEAELVNDTDVTLIDPQFDDMLVMYVAKKMAMRKGEADDLRWANAEIDEWRKRARSHVRKSKELLRVKTRWDTRGF